MALMMVAIFGQLRELLQGMLRGRLCSLGQRSTIGSCPPSSLKPLYVIEHGNGGKNGLGGSYNGGGFINHSEKVTITLSR